MGETYKYRSDYLEHINYIRAYIGRVVPVVRSFTDSKRGKNSAIQISLNQLQAQSQISDTKTEVLEVRISILDYLNDPFCIGRSLLHVYLLCFTCSVP